MNTIGLYIHWPFCARLCPYCDFNIYKNRPDFESVLIDSILVDMRYWREMSRARNLASIHFGGGTPSLMTANNVRRIIDLACELWTPVTAMEIGLEANPKDISTQNLHALRGAGIERLSVGVQSFDTEVLSFLGRDHDGKQSLTALKHAVKIMPRVSADLIYGWRGQSLNAWEHDLNTAITSGVDHVSAYQLTIEQRTAFARAEMRGHNKAVDEDTSADLYEHGLDILGKAGFSQYEVSNFSKTDAARSRHNLLYWQGEDYVGVGPGAHGRLTTQGVRQATVCALKPQTYIEHVTEHGHGMESQEPLSREAWGQEYLLMGLRIEAGISLSHFAAISGQTLGQEQMDIFVKAKLLDRSNGRICATPSGRLVLDRLSHDLLLG